MSDSEYISPEDSDEMPPPRRRPRPPVIIGIIILIVVIIVGGYFAIRSFGKGASALIATPTPTLPPGTNLVSFVTNPAWGSIAIDGHSLTSIPRPGQLPLHLSTGVHEITWNAPPFPVQRCFLNVPPQSVSGSGTCNTTNSTVSTTIVAFTAASTSLPQSQQASLTGAVQTYARSLQASTLVQQGEHYASAQTAQGIAIAAQPLQATAHFQFDLNPNSTQSCFNQVGGTNTPSCSVNGVACQALCPMTASDPNLLAAHPSWSVYVPLRITWSYAALNGQIVAQNEPGGTGKNEYENLLPLYLTWNGSKWQMTDQAGVPVTNLPDFTTNPLCMAAQTTWIDNPSNPFLHSTMFNGQSASTNDFQYRAGANAINGCLISAAPRNQNGTPILSAPAASLLYRFGVLLTVNAATHRYWPNLPVADAYEQGIAQQLMKGS
jgi:hypothetical protein